MKKLTILHVEDSYRQREEFGSGLKSLGYKLIFAVDGVEGLETYKKYMDKKKKIDIILTDYCMPRLDGNTMASLIRREDKEIPIIGYSMSPKNFDEFLFDAVVDKAGRRTVERIHYSIESIFAKNDHKTIEYIKRQNGLLSRMVSKIRQMRIFSKPKV